MINRNFHTFGDSHCYFGWDAIKKVNGFNIICHHIGPTLMFSVGRDGLKRLNVSEEKFQVKEGDYVCFCFGEIDCRSHVNKYKEKGYKQVIDKMVENYFNTIDLNKKLFKNLKIVVYNVVPPVKKGRVGENKNFPFLGTDNERLIYTKYMNNKLREYCQNNNYIFIDVYKFYSDPDGFLNYNLSDGKVHIKNPIFLKKYLESIL